MATCLDCNGSGCVCSECGDGEWDCNCPDGPAEHLDNCDLCDGTGDVDDEEEE